MLPNELIFTVSDFVAVFNQTLSYTYPNVTIEGEIDSFRIGKNRWVYFNLKDENSLVRFFGNVNQLPGPLEDGLLMRVTGIPHLHNLYGFNINVQTMQPVGEGSIKRAAQLLEAKLAKEGLFDESRKRPLPHPPVRVGLVSSIGSAAYHDFIKIMGERWGNIEIQVVDVQVQGDIAPTQIVGALEYFNTHKSPVDVLVLIRGGGSAEDLAAFNTELVTRAIATSRIVTLVAIGHEVDISLAEKAADRRGSTPTHAAEILTPDKRVVLQQLENDKLILLQSLDNQFRQTKERINDTKRTINSAWEDYFNRLKTQLNQQSALLNVLSPASALKRGYAVLKLKGKIVSSGKLIKAKDNLEVNLHDADLNVLVTDIKLK